MKTIVSKLLDLLSPQERRRAFLLLGMIILMALLDMVGVASVMPFMAVLANPEAVENNSKIAFIYHYFGFSDTSAFLYFLGLAVLVAIVGSIAFKALTTYALLRFTHMREYTLGRKLVAGYLHQPYEWFLNRHSAELGKTVLSEVSKVISGALVPMMQFIAHATVAIGLIVLLVIVDPVLAISVAAGLGFSYGFIYLLLRRYLARIGANFVQANGERYQVMQETFGGIKEVKLSGLEALMLNRFDGPCKRLIQSEVASQVAAQLPRFAMEIITFGGLLIIVFYLMSGAGGIQNALPLITLYAFAGLRLMPALQNVYGQLAMLRYAGPALDSLHNNLSMVCASASAKFDLERVTPMNFTQSLRLENVTYTYPATERPALKELSISIQARTTVGLVGSTGSGKTTTVDLILGLLRSQQGCLYVDDTAITGENVRAWQRTIGYVPQQIYLADDTIIANIAFGIPAEQVDLDAVKTAARIAELHEFITNEMPDGYNTKVGERGVRLSGGQRQRIGIARALYHDPEVLVMDEATSALDNLTEKAVMDAVHNLCHRKTIILIAHRLSTVSECNTIFMMDRGQVVASGTYEELIARNEKFKAMAGTTT